MNLTEGYCLVGVSLAKSATIQTPTETLMDEERLTIVSASAKIERAVSGRSGIGGGGPYGGGTEGGVVYDCNVGRAGLRKERKGRDDLYCRGVIDGE